MAAVIESRVTLPAVPSMAAVARAHVAHVLDGTPRVDDARLIASELVTVAIATGHHDFSIGVTLTGTRARIEVQDSRPLPELRIPPVDGEARPGIGVVSLLADDMGHDADAGMRWAELSWGDCTHE